ncbi:MAG TPA: LytTR family DNA-binding domain-containing protein [Chitinophagaceae bacterium]|nr:LytTR family DNA-binding domain-containing protein [Chitinophagaceae bacterium]
MPLHKKIRCLVIEDEQPAMDILHKHIQGVDALELTGSCSNAVEALSFLQSNTVDLLFLDIQMPHILGTNFIRTLKNPPKVIFTTAYRKYAVEGFELDAVDFLLKPISFDRFLKAVNKILQLSLQSNFDDTKRPENVKEPVQSFLYFRSDRKMVKILFNDILYIEGLRDYIKIYTTSKVIVTKHQLASLEEMLPADGFLRIHRSFIVSINKIDSYNADMIEISKKPIPIGRMYKHNVSRLLNSP